MDVRNLVAQHDALARRFKVYEQRVGELPPVEVPLIARRQDELDREGRSLRDRQWVMLLVGALVGALVSLLMTGVWDWLQ